MRHAGVYSGPDALARAALLSEPANRLTPSPTKAAVDYAAMETTIENKISSGSLGLSTINAVLVSVDGETKVAHYRNGSKPEDALHVVSVTKSVASALIGIAIGEKIISGLDATLPELLPRYGKYLTAEEKSITLRQLMSMTSGFPIRGTRRQVRQGIRADRSDTSYPHRRLGVAARRSFQLFESWRASRVRRATGSPGAS